jgi:hypothetical protein
VTGAPPLARLVALGFPETARLLESGRPDAATLAHCALNRMEARDRSRLPGSVPVIRARYAVARRLVRLALLGLAAAACAGPVFRPRAEGEEMVN